MSENNQPNLLVTGASGQLGRRVVELLLEKQVGNIIATTRSPEKLADLSQRGVTVRHADFDQPDSLVNAFANVDRLLLISTDALGQPGVRLNQHRTAITAAESAGVGHIVYTSFVNPEPESAVLFSPDHYGTEKALEASQLNWTVLRNNLYADLVIGKLSQAISLGGQLFSATEDGKISYITREDCARVAAAALASSFNGRQILDVTGSESLSITDIANLAHKLLQQNITYVPITLEALTQNMISAGLPQPLAETYASIDEATKQGQFDTISTVVQDLTGKKPVSLEEFLTANLHVFASQASE